MSGLLKSNLIVAAGTALSRLTGLVRFGVLAAVLGGTALSDAYLLANETPNIVYELLVGGVLSATLVPLFTSFDAHDDDESRNVVISTALVIIAATTVVAVAAAPLIFRAFSARVDADVDPEVFRSVGTTLVADLPHPDPVLRAHRAWPTRSSTAAAGSSLRHGARSCPT